MKREKERNSSKESLKRVSSTIAVRKLKHRVDHTDQDKILEAVKEFLIQKGYFRTAEQLRQEKTQSRPKQSR